MFFVYTDKNTDNFITQKIKYLHNFVCKIGNTSADVWHVDNCSFWRMREQFNFRDWTIRIEKRQLQLELYGFVYNYKLKLDQTIPTVDVLDLCARLTKKSGECSVWKKQWNCTRLKLQLSSQQTTVDRWLIIRETVQSDCDCFS